MFGRRGRVCLFLLSLLASTAQDQYRLALSQFSAWCIQRNLFFENLSEQEQDIVACDFILACRDEGQSIQLLKDLVSALQKHWPRRRYTTAWTVISAWNVERPPDQAAPIPEQAALAAAVLLVASGEAPAGLAVLLILWAPPRRQGIVGACC